MEPLPPSIPALDRATAADRFDALQKKLVAQWQLIRAFNPEEQTIVVVPSISLEIDAPGSVLQAYEERFLFLLLLLRQPRARLIYVTSLPILPEIVEYYLALLPGVIPSHARRRLHTLAVLDGSPRPLSQKLLERPRLLARILKLIPDPGTAHLVPYNTTDLERDLAVRLGIPMYAADPRLFPLGTKSGARRLFAEEGVPHALGFEDLRSFEDLVEAARRLRAARPRAAEALVKLNEGVSGEGNARVDLRDLPAPGEPDEGRAIEERLHAMAFEHHAASLKEYLRKLEERGGVLEERIAGAELRSPSVQMRVTPLGEVQILSTHDQLLGGPGGQSYLGCTFPADPAYARRIATLARPVGERLAREGVIGRFALDFVVVRGADGAWEPYAIEINLRKGGTTHPYLTLEFLTDGSYDPERAVFTTRHGRAKCYVASDHFESPLYRHLAPDDLFDFAMRAELHFNQATQTGIVFHMLSSVSEHGRFGLTAVADSHAEAHALYERAATGLEGEARAALEERGLPEA